MAQTPAPGHTLAHPTQPTDLLLYRLAKLAAASGRLVTRLCERRHGITRREWGVLMWLAREPGLPPSVLAERLELDRARVSRALSSLQAKGLVHKAAVAQRTALHLTPAGQQLHDALWPEIRAINQQLARSLDGPHLAHLDGALALLQERAQQLESTPAGAAPFAPRSGGARHTAVQAGPAARGEPQS